MFGLVKKMFIGLLTGVISATNHTKCVLLSNQKCTIQSSIITLHPKEYTQGLHSCSSAVNLDKCVGSCNTLNDLSNKVYVFQKKNRRFKFGHVQHDYWNK